MRQKAIKQQNAALSIVHRAQVAKLWKSFLNYVLCIKILIFPVLLSFPAETII